MSHSLRWQVALAATGLAVIGVLLSLLANRTFVDRPARGGQLLEAVVGSPVVLNPLFASSDVEIDIARLIYSGLTRPDPDGLVAPDLATRWQVSDDGTTYTFFLRRDAVWHDGEPVTAEDVVFTARLAADDRLQTVLGQTARQWANAEARVVDASTVEVTLPEPYAAFLAATNLGILPLHIFGDIPLDQLPEHRHSTLEPIGSGPFRLLTPGGVTEDSLQLVRFDDHWASTDRQPYVDGITFAFFPDEQSALDALGRQTVHTVGGLSADPSQTSGTGASSYAAGQAGYTLVYLNLQRVLFRDVNVRRALSIALDRDGIVSDAELLNGEGIPATSPIPRGSWAYDGELAPPRFDPAEARRILEAAGWIDSDDNGVRDREGKSLSLTLAVASDPLQTAIAQRISDRWTDIGVQVKVQPVDQPRLIRDLTEHSFDAVLFSWSLQSHDPDPFPLWHSSQIEDGQNFSAWSDPEVDEWLAEARRTPDSARRADLYARFQRRFVREQPAIMLYHPLYIYAVHEGAVGGVQLPRLVVEPADRFVTLRDWFLETERVFLGDRQEE